MQFDEPSLRMSAQRVPLRPLGYRQAMSDAEKVDNADVVYQGVYERLPVRPDVRRGSSEQTDWELEFVSVLASRLTSRHQHTGIYEVERIEWAVGTLTVVVRVWHTETESGLVGWREDLTLLRSQFTPDDAHLVADAWHVGEFFPRRFPSPFRPGTDGIHWIRTS